DTGRADHQRRPAGTARRRRRLPSGRGDDAVIEPGGGEAIGGRDLMTTPDELRKAMAEQDFAEGEVVTGHRPVSVVVSFRAPAEWSAEILAEMQRRGLDNPSQLMKALLREGLDRAAGGNARVVTVRVDDLHRAIDSIVLRAAA